jgi:hypothetical protein
MEENIQETQVTVLDSSLGEIIKAEIDTQISTAKAYPRSLKVFQDKAISMATLTIEIAESCTYALSRAGKSITGPSVRLAEIAVSNYGNIRAGARVISNDGKTITAQGLCHDLETNYAVTVEVKRRITDKNGKTFSEDMQVVTGNAAAAIAFRNAVFKVVPGALVHPIWEAAKKVAKGSAETLVDRRTKAVKYFNDLGVKNDQICESLGIKKVEDVDLDKLEILTGMRSAYINGEATIKDMFEKDKISIEDLSLLFDMKKGSLAKDEISDIERIIKNKEEASFKKVNELLMSK